MCCARNVIRKQPVDGFNLLVWNRYWLTAHGDESRDASRKQNSPSDLGGHAAVHKQVPREQWPFNLFTSIAPAMNFRNAREKGGNSLTLELAGDDPLMPGHRLQRVPIAGRWKSQPSSLIRELRGTNHSFALWVTFAGSALKNFVCREMFAERGGSFRDEQITETSRVCNQVQETELPGEFVLYLPKRGRYFMRELENPSNGGNLAGEQIL
jgi:hypothetical protein